MSPARVLAAQPRRVRKGARHVLDVRAVLRTRPHQRFSARTCSSRAGQRDVTHACPREGQSPMTTAPTPRPAPTQAPAQRPAGARPPQKKASRLGMAKRERLQVPLFYLWYGPEGIGKTSLLADMPDPIVADIEGGSAKVEIARYQFRDGDGGNVAYSYDEFTGAIEDLISNPGHGFRTLGIDTADALEALIHTHICKRDGEDNVQGYGYGKGYKVAVAELRVLIS